MNHHPTAPRTAAWWTSCLLVLLSACGGGGGKDSSTAAGTTPSASSSGGTAATATPAASAPVVATAQAVQLSGVVAVAAPLAGAVVQVIDATGAVVGSTTSRAADGGYSLATSAATAPLMLQASGVDANGAPVVMHSALSASAGSATVNITPLTDAVLALALGSEPRAAFVAAQPATLAKLASLTAAADFLKTVVKTPLTDAKITDTKKLDLLGDSGFVANKTGVDLALETLAVGYASDANGKPLLTLGNKLANTPAEVTVNLATAATELAKTTGAAPNNAITSLALATTSPTTMMASLGALDELPAALNKLIAESTSLDTDAAVSKLKAATALAKYTVHDGKDATALATRIAGWAAKRMQIGRVQVLGCADETIAKTGCTKVLVQARVNDSTGAQADALVDAISYDSKTTPKWTLVGNNLGSGLEVRSVAWLALGPDGSTLATVNGGQPTTGVQLAVGSGASAATVQTPSGYALPLLPCNLSVLCVASGSGTATTTAAKGTLADTAVLRGVNAWLGNADLAAGAKYKATLTASDGSTSSRTAPLRGSFATAPALGGFAVLDDLSASRPLSGSMLLAGGTLSWATWAASRPDLRVVAVRRVLVDSEGAVTVTDLTPLPWPANSATLTASEATDVAAVLLWLTVVDGAGRWWQTSYSVL